MNRRIDWAVHSVKDCRANYRMGSVSAWWQRAVTPEMCSSHARA